MGNSPFCDTKVANPYNFIISNGGFLGIKESSPTSFNKVNFSTPSGIHWHLNLCRVHMEYSLTTPKETRKGGPFMGPGFSLALLASELQDPNTWAQHVGHRTEAQPAPRAHLFAAKHMKPLRCKGPREERRVAAGAPLFTSRGPGVTPTKYIYFIGLRGTGC